MIITLFIILSSASIFASIIALYVLIIGSFEKKDKKEERVEHHYIKNTSRIRNVNKINENKIHQSKGLNTQVSSLLWTVIIGQAVGLYFLFVFLSKNEAVHIILRINGFFLLIAAFLCSILTMFNGWLKKKMEIPFRLIFQGYSLGVAIILFRLGIHRGVSVKEAVVAAGIFPNITIVVFFTTVILALILMLLDALYRKHERVDFNYNIYFLIVVIVGMVVGLSLLFALSAL